MTKIMIVIFVAITSSLWSLGQTTADTNLKFLISKIKAVYAGYPYKTTDAQFDRIVKEPFSKPYPDSFVQLSRITTFFSDAHLALYQVFSNPDTTSCFSNRKIMAASARQPHLTKYEGYWVNDLGDQIIQMISDKNGVLNGYIIETRLSAPVGLKVLSLYRDSTGWLADVTRLDYKYRVVTRSYMRNDSVLICGYQAKWRKVKLYKPGLLNLIPVSEKYPSLRVLDSNTILIRMPDFDGSLFPIYDSLLKANKIVLSQAKTLILDVRNNIGGSISNIEPITPYVCTAPLYLFGSLRRSSEEALNEALQSRDRFKQRGDTITMKLFDKYIDGLKKATGGFYELESDTLVCESTPNSIRNVGIITNYAAVSAVELMILYYKQSPKVKLFGEATGGVVDYLNAIYLRMPSPGLLLMVATAKRKLVSGFGSYDGKGIPPDVPIPDSEKDWVLFTKRFYEKN